MTEWSVACSPVIPLRLRAWGRHISIFSSKNQVVAMDIFLKSTKELEHRIDQFLDAISEGALVFRSGVQHYLDEDMERLDERIGTISTLESSADKLRRDIESTLYTHSLIPEHRGDVLGLLETMDNIIDTAKMALNQFAVELPDIPEEFHNDFMELVQTTVQATEAVVQAARAFFRDPLAIKNCLHKVYFYEKEGDKSADRLKRAIFRSTLTLAHKLHLRFFAQHIDDISDRAEEVADRLAIYAIKRTV